MSLLPGPFLSGVAGNYSRLNLLQQIPHLVLRVSRPLWESTLWDEWRESLTMERDRRKKPPCLLTHLVDRHERDRHFLRRRSDRPTFD